MCSGTGTFGTAPPSQRTRTIVRWGSAWTFSPKTVDTYRARIMDKLGLTHRSELVRFALRAGLLKDI